MKSDRINIDGITVVVHFQSAGMGRTDYMTYINGVQARVMRDEGKKQPFYTYADDHPETRIKAVEEYKRREWLEFLDYLELHPEMKEYAPECPFYQ